MPRAGRVVDVGRGDEPAHVAGQRRRQPGVGRDARVRARVARLTPSAAIAASTTTTVPGGVPPSPAAVPTRTSRRAPSPISARTTAAALGPPRPVLWIVSGAPSAAGPV